MASMIHQGAWLAAACVLACGNGAPPSDEALGIAGRGGVAGDAQSGGGAPVAAAGGSESGGRPAGGAGSAGANEGGDRAGAASAAAGQAGGGTAGGVTSSAGAGAGAGGSASTSPKRVLLYHFSTLAIASVPEQLTLLSARLQEWGYEVEESDDPADINPTTLGTLSAVGMINTCFEPFGKGSAGNTQSAALAAFVDAGGGLFGTHCASVTFQTANPPHPYNQLVGGRGGDGYFDGVSACKTEGAHPSTLLLPSSFDYQGNLDNADFLGPDTTVVVRCQWSGGAKKDVPVSWYRASGKGRVFYTNFAKEAVDLQNPMLGDKHILLGLGWVLGR